MSQGAVVLGEHAFREVHARQERKLSPALSFGLSIWAILVATLALWNVFRPLRQGTQYYSIIFLGLTLPLVFLCYPLARYRRKAVGGRPGDDTPGVLDWGLAVLALLAGFYPLLPLVVGGGGGGFDAFLDRQGTLSGLDVVMGSVLLLAVLEAARRATGMILPVVCAIFLAYSYYGGYLPRGWAVAHAGVDFSQIVNGLYSGTSGFFGSPLYAAATYIFLFNVYGAVLDASGAPTFFVEVSLAAFHRSRAAPGRTAVLGGFLLGSGSGSGAATTAAVSAATWPILKRAGYPPENAGGLLAATGIGAMLSPPTLGAAAFIIAEYLDMRYFDVLVWALVPALLYYLGVMLAVEADARKLRFNADDATGAGTRARWWPLLRSSHHLFSLIIIIMFLALDNFSPYAVVYATAVPAFFALAAKLRQQRATPIRAVGAWVTCLVSAVAAGVRSTLPVVAVCAAAGVITSTIAKSGVGLVLSSTLVDAAHVLGNNPNVVLVLTLLFSALAVGILGLAVPVVASFIIAWVALTPALNDVGVSSTEAAMFLFYFAVLSEVTPPTGLAPLAASAITGGSVNRTIMQSWKYALPAFLVPFAFTLTDNGSALLGQRQLVDVLWVTAVSALGVAALAAAVSGWMVRPVGWPERALCVPAAMLLLYIQPLTIMLGVVILAIAVAVNVLARPRPADAKVSEVTVSE